MAINFPNPASDGEQFTDASSGLVYTWNASKGVWETTFTPNASADNKYVEVAGDNMTDNLTFRTNKITLDASTGNGEFSGGVTLSGGAPSIVTTAGIYYNKNSNFIAISARDYDTNNIPAEDGEPGQVGDVVARPLGVEGDHLVAHARKKRLQRPVECLLDVGIPILQILEAMLLLALGLVVRCLRLQVPGPL